MKYRKILTPDGFNDSLELEFAFKNDVLVKLHRIFNSYGYSRISTPTLEYLDVFNNKGSMDSKNIFKFIDKDGEILALRPDITPSIARIVSNNYDEQNVPYRLCYIENTFAQNRNYQGKSREITQAGVELIGLNTTDSDSEIILLAINCLLSNGLDDFKIEIGNVKFLQGCILDLGLTDNEKDELQKLIIKGNYAEVSNFINCLEIKKSQKSFFNNLFTYTGDINILFNAKKYAMNQISLSAIDRLIEIHKFLDDAGVSKYVCYDLSLIGHFDYYTGLIFHGYTKSVGSSILDGGRYDRLIENFGTYMPSVGFAIKANGLIDGLLKQNKLIIDRSSHTLISYNEFTRKLALQTASFLREDNGVYELSLFNDIDKTIEYAKNNGFGGVLNFKHVDFVEIIDLNNDTSNVIPISELMGGYDNEK